MASSKSVPRLLQPQVPVPRPGGEAVHQGMKKGIHKGDLRSPADAGKPSQDREVGDLERAEREGHGKA